jgi:hypothetical protein
MKTLLLCVVLSLVVVILTIAFQEFSSATFTCRQFQPAHYFSKGPTIAKVHAPHTATSNTPFTLSFD